MMTTSSAAHILSMEHHFRGLHKTRCDPADLATGEEGTPSGCRVRVPATDIAPPMMIGDVESTYPPDGRTACLKLNSRRTNCRRYQWEHDFRLRLVSQPKAKLCFGVVTFIIRNIRGLGSAFPTPWISLRHLQETKLFNNISYRFSCMTV